jgi:hypothetical protein
VRGRFNRAAFHIYAAIKIFEFRTCKTQWAKMQITFLADYEQERAGHLGQGVVRPKPFYMLLAVTAVASAQGCSRNPE